MTQAFQPLGRSFIYGVLLGFSVAYMTSLLLKLQSNLYRFKKHTLPISGLSYREMMMLRDLETGPDEQSEAMDTDSLENQMKIQFNDSHSHHDNDAVAEELKKKVRVLCWIMTGPQNLEKKAIHVKKTWGKRCNILLFMSSVEDKDFPTVGLNVSEGRDHLLAKTMEAFRYVYKHYYDEADWFLKADDDTYVILENLRYFLSDKNTFDPYFYGQNFNKYVKQGYYSGGAGYVLGKAALKVLVQRGWNRRYCRQDGGAEDLELGRCLYNLGINTSSTLDSMGRSRFHCFVPESHINGGYPKWYMSYDKYGGKKGIESISDYAISFHYVPPQKMYALEFYIYHLRPFGIESGHQHLN